MPKNIIVLVLFMVVGCSSKTQTEEIHDLAKWNGKHISELLDHTYFKNLPKIEKAYEDGSKFLLLTDQSKFQTGAYCQSLGGCMGMPIYDCLYMVKYIDDFITGIENRGSCPPSKNITP